ncbi:MAG: hypothetical protein J2P37_35805 [Ktedonobacteraceae bacterium]|nr:hypothetical protein [Ktedonobacteraceae bacterium]
MEPSANGQIYTLRLETLLEILRTHRHPYELWAEAPADMLLATNGRSHRGSERMRCEIRLVVEQGHVRACQIHDRERRQVLLTGPLALTQCQQCAELTWRVRLVPSSSSPSVPHAPTPTVMPLDSLRPFPGVIQTWEVHPPPHRAGLLTQEQLARLSRQHRRVLLLVNGRRDIAALSSILHCPPERLMNILRELEAQHLITPGTFHDGGQVDS